LRGGKGLTSDEIVREAQRFAQQLGWPPAKFVVASVKKRNKNYVVFFRGKSGQEGDHFSVIVDGVTGKGMRLVPGR
jgi:hypothetical protein